MERASAGSDRIAGPIPVGQYWFAHRAPRKGSAPSLFRILAQQGLLLGSMSGRARSVCGFCDGEEGG